MAARPHGHRPAWARGRAMRVHARLGGRAVTGPRGPASARLQFLPRPQVNPRPDEKDVRTDIFIKKRPL
jgi:hypothetical protein